MWILGSTRVHLDELGGLGTFVELETVIGHEPGDAYRAEHELALALVAVDAGSAVRSSYVDLIEQR